MQLQDYLVQFGIKQQALAEKLGISRSHISELANGQALPSLKLARDIELQTEGHVALQDWVPVPPAEGAGVGNDGGCL